MKICFHKYGKWSDPVDTYESNVKNQFCKCDKCGKIKSRRIYHSVQITAQEIIDSLAKVHRVNNGL